MLFAQIRTIPTRSSMSEVYVCPFLTRYFLPGRRERVFENFNPFSSFWRISGDGESTSNCGKTFSYERAFSRVMSSIFRAISSHKCSIALLWSIVTYHPSQSFAPRSRAIERIYVPTETSISSVSSGNEYARILEEYISIVRSGTTTLSPARAIL